MNKLYLNSITVDTPPQHCIVKVRCDTCSKREVCYYQSDYRKTVTLIQNILGDPQLDREVLFNDCGFTGFDFEDYSIFPTTYDIVPKVEGESIVAEFLNARYSSKDTVKLLVKIDKQLVLFILKYDESFYKYTANIGRELYFGIPYELTTEAEESLQIPLLLWREEMIEEEEKHKDDDIINTTPFSAILNCKYYAAPNNTAIRNPNKFTNYNLDDDKYYHVATFHREPAEVKEYCQGFRPPVGFYPYLIPAPAPKPPKKPPVRRDDQ